MLIEGKGICLYFFVFFVSLPVTVWRLYGVGQRCVGQMNAVAISKSLHVLRPLFL